MNMMRSISSSRKLQDDLSSSFRTHVPPAHRELLLPSFHIEEVRPGRHIHEGKYTSTYEISTILQNHKAEDVRHQWARDMIDKDGRRRTSTGMLSNHERQQRLCIKFIRREFMDSHEDFESAASNLANDAQMMSALNHKNIAKLRGSSLDGTEAYYKTGRHDGYFLLVDRISETLEDRIAKWRGRNCWLRLRQRSGCLGSRTTSDFLLERLQCAYELADAIDYMHEHGIAHTNLTERSVGFTAQGDLQIFELGDAVPITASSRYFERNMTRSDSRGGKTGLSFGENERGDGAALKADVFAYTRLLCEILALRPKVKGLPSGRISHHAEGKSTIRAFRKLAKVVPSELLQLLQRGLSLRAELRPSMSEYSLLLAEILSRSLDAEKNSKNPPKLLYGRTHSKLHLSALKPASKRQVDTDETFHCSFGDSFSDPAHSSRPFR